MINTSKITQNPTISQVAGVDPSDSSIEFIGNKDTFETLWLQHGTAHYWRDLTTENRLLISDAYENKYPKAKAFISKLTDDYNRQLEIFTCYMWGDLDATPDISDGKLSNSENFRTKEDCPSLLWNSMNIGDHNLTPRQLFIVDQIAKDLPDKQIAASLGITDSTYNWHKKRLFEAVQVNTKCGLLKKAMQWKVVA